MADTRDLKSLIRKGVRVRIPLRLPRKNKMRIIVTVDGKEVSRRVADDKYASKVDALIHHALNAEVSSRACSHKYKRFLPSEFEEITITVTKPCQGAT